MANFLTTFKSGLILAALVTCLMPGISCFGQSVNTSSGTDFWFGYTLTQDLTNASYVVYINTYETTNGTVSIPGSLWSTNFTAVPGITTRIVVPSADVVVTSFTGPVSQAVNVVADSNISVYAAIEYTLRTDNSCILPVSLLGNQYYVMDYSILNTFSEFMVVAQGCKDSVEIIPSQNITVGGSHPAGVPFTEVLQPGQEFIVQCDSDLTGSEVISLNHSETGVFAAANWNEVYCTGTSNPFYEELLPTNTWGENFVFVPTPQAQDQCRVLAEQNGTTVTFSTNSGNNIKTLNAGQYYDTTVNYATPVFINASNPVSVGRFMRSMQCNDYYITNPTNKGDPAEVVVDANEQMFLDSITFYVSRTPDIDSTYIQIVTRTTDINTIFLDNVNIAAFFNTLIPNPAYSYCSLTILPGSHILTTTGQGFVAYTCGLGYEDAEAQAASVYLTEINITTSSTQPSTCSASDGTATVSATGIPPFIYSWSNGETTSTATGLSAGIYTVTVTDSDCVPHKTTAIVNISGAAGYSASVTDTNPTCVNPLGSSTAIPSGGTTPYTYSWSNGETTQTATGLSAGSYTCTITDNGGCEYFATTYIMNYVPPSIGIAPYNDTVCGDSSQVLRVYGLNTGIYNWAPNTGLSCYTCPEPTASPTVTTTYTITGADSNGCSASGTVTIAVLAVPKPIITGKDTVCSGYTDTLSVTGGSSYSWSTGATTSSISFVVSATRTYTATATTSCGSHDTTFTIHVVSPAASIAASKDSICKGDSVQLTGSGGASYYWSTGSTSTSIWVKPDTATTYVLHAYLATCSDSASIEIKIISPPAASISVIHDTICPFDTAMLTVRTGGNTTYKWNTGATTSTIQVNPSITTTYTVNVFGICDSTKDTVKVIVSPIPNIVFIGDSSACLGASDTILASGGISYLWDNGDTTATYITGAIKGDSTLSVTAYSSIGCLSTKQITITVHPSPKDSIAYAKVCKYQPVVIYANAKGAGPFTYSWSPGGQTSDSIIVADSGQTEVLIVSNGCKLKTTFTVTPDAPILTACCDKIIFLGDDTILVVGGANSYQWSPSVICLNDSCDSVRISPTVTTTYTITGRDRLGCENQTTVIIIVEEPCFNFTVPNVFTPNYPGPNGLNSILYIKDSTLNSWSMIIFDRWGKEVYNSTDPKEFWTGNTENGDKAPDGVYYYIIKASCQGNTYKKEGFVQLIR